MSGDAKVGGFLERVWYWVKGFAISHKIITGLVVLSVVSYAIFKYGGGTIAMIGLFIFLFSVGMAVHDLGFFPFPSSKQESLAQKFKSQKESNSPTDAETDSAYMDVWLRTVNGFLMVVGIVLMMIGGFVRLIFNY